MSEESPIALKSKPTRRPPVAAISPHEKSGLGQPKKQQ
jgi:hypothetical protein